MNLIIFLSDIKIFLLIIISTFLTNIKSSAL